MNMYLCSPTDMWLKIVIILVKRVPLSRGRVFKYDSTHYLHQCFEECCFVVTHDLQFFHRNYQCCRCRIVVSLMNRLVFFDDINQSSMISRCSLRERNHLHSHYTAEA